jgi:phenylpropionate dioxygenase-like ring-hydroxylating dioxygenase large terminal subunit
MKEPAMNELSSGEQARGLLSQNLPYPRNHWYVAAGRSEVSRKLLGRKLLGKCIVLYRTEAGEAVAMDDWCPHRGFRFSQSELIGDNIRCGYHGMTFGPKGNCVHVPSQEMIPAKLAVTAYPVVERRDFVWIWLGDPAKADRALLPAELEFEDPSYFSGYFGTVAADCNAAVALENVIDITHASLLHPGVLDGDNWELMTARDEVETLQPTVIQTTKRFGRMKVTGALAERNGLPQNTEVTRIRIAREYLPGLHTSCETYYDADDASKVLARRIRYNGITPQDERSCFIFTAYSGTTQYGPAALQKAMETLHQDLVALASTQNYFDQGGESFKEVSVRADGAALLARRIIAKLAAQESATE